jgi:hypothetical protein
MGTVEVLGMPLLTSAVDQQIEETATMEKKCHQLSPQKACKKLSTTNILRYIKKKMHNFTPCPRLIL